ncbi:hypothetical protein GWI33_016984 [Rhynchophorus ferrugineus]|uniref:Uncharacterized protein n=1 Tax=Rhynchophorus ferrugineus TaxID=354439 RepID=A0A834HWE5_RHYFE|nr:hypothetical protein GWI33_016984 [Rhynchophorus ferrugineus]
MKTYSRPKRRFPLAVGPSVQKSGSFTATRSGCSENKRKIIRRMPLMAIPQASATPSEKTVCLLTQRLCPVFFPPPFVPAPPTVVPYIQHLAYLCYSHCSVFFTATSPPLHDFDFDIFLFAMNTVEGEHDCFHCELSFDGSA